MLQNLRIGLKAQANIYAAGLTYIYIVAIVGTVVGLVAVVWCAFQIVMLMLLSVVEVASIIGSLYNGSDSLTKLLILCIAGTLVYRIARKVWRK